MKDDISLAGGPTWGFQKNRTASRMPEAIPHVIFFIWGLSLGSASAWIRVFVLRSVSGIAEAALIVKLTGRHVGS